MNAREEFDAAPVGATARSPYQTFVKVGLSTAPWVSEVRYPGGGRSMERVSSDYLAEQGHVLDLSPAVPASAREALDLAWDLAHPVKEGQVIPEGDVVLSGSRDHFTCETAYRDTPVGPSGANWFRTLDPLPDPE